MVVLATKLKIPLDDGWELYVVNQGPRAQVILSFNENSSGPVRERISVHLDHSKAIQLARALAGVTNQSGPYTPPPQDDEEDTIP